MFGRSFGLIEKEIDEILEKEGIKSGESISAEMTRKAIASAIEANNNKIADYLQRDYIEFINEELARKLQQEARSHGLRF